MDSPQKISPEAKKKPYKKPEVRVYGDLRGITQTVHTLRSTTDSGGQPNKTM